MDEKEIKRVANMHMVRCIIVVMVVMFLTQLVLKYFFLGSYTVGMKALSVAAAFSIAESVVVPKLWQWVAASHRNFLSTFHTACSGFRMLLVLAILGIVCAIVGRDAMVPYVIVFMLYYLVLLIMHTVFFAKTTNKLFKK